MKKLYDLMCDNFVNWVVLMMLSLVFLFTFYEPLFSLAVVVLATIYTSFGLNRRKIEIKYFSDDVPRLEKIEQGDWIDLYSAEDVHLLIGESKAIRLGVGMKLPRGYEAIIAPRSSTLKYFNVVCGNSIGVIDNSYNGDSDEWHFLAYATEYTHIKKGDKICQFRIVKNQPSIKFHEVKNLDDKSRGGFGTTGTR